ncbi:MAG: hypothetical protein POELPBGB_00314 [Bacteroidia bacterium]|nr:hypothetical protein [Bacteroidia bacterium]
MNAKYFLILLLSSLVVLHGCNELDPDDPYELTLADFLQNNKPALQTFTVQAGVASEIHGAKGCTINFNANSFSTLAGVPIGSGNVEIQLREVTTKKDMVLSQTPTISDNELIVSKGVYYLKALQNGFELRIKNFSIVKTVAADTNNLKAFLGTTNGDSFNWISSDTIGYVYDSTSTDSTFYQMQIFSTYLSQNYNWINCDYFYNSSAPRVAVFFPTTDSINVYYFQSYLVFNNLNAVLHYNGYSTNQIEFYNIPEGLDATLVTYYIVDGTPFVATADITVSDALSTPITFTETTEQGLLSILEGL